MDFRIEFQDVAELQNDLALYREKAIRAFQGIDDAVKRMKALGSFDGEAAESIKSYMSEVHGKMLLSLRNLLDVLAADYAKEYYRLFGTKPVEDADFSSKWSFQTMAGAEAKIWSMTTGDGALTQIRAQVEKAVNIAAEAGCSCETPSPDAFRSAANYEAMQTQKVRDGVANIEERGYKTFSSNRGEFLSLLVAARLSLMRLGPPGAPSGALTYKAGSFSSFAKANGLDSANERAAVKIEQAKGDVFAACKDSFTQSLDWNARKIDKALKSKKNMLYLKLVGLLIGAACVVVEIASGGTATPVVVSVLALGSSMGDAVDTLSQVQDIGNGGLGIQIITDKQGREVLKVGHEVYEYSEEMPALIKMLKSNDSKGLEKYLAQKSVSALQGEIPKSFGKEAKADYDALRSFAKAAKGSFDENLTFSGGAGLISKSMTATANSLIARIDDDIASRVERIDDLQGTFGSMFGRKPSTVSYSTLIDEGSSCVYDSTSLRPEAQEPLVGTYKPGSGRIAPIL